jgi:predicted metal-binding protein
VVFFSLKSTKVVAFLSAMKADMMYIASSVLGALSLPVSKTPLLKNLGTEDGAVVTASICPLHGPIVRSSVTELVREYREVVLLTFDNPRGELTNINETNIPYEA